MAAPPVDELVVLRRTDLEQLLNVALEQHRKQMLLDLAKLQETADRHDDRLLPAASMAKALAMSTRSFFRLVEQHPALRTLRQGNLWPEKRIKAAVGALRA